MTDFPKVAFIGAGNMNTAILKGMLNQGYPRQNIWVSNRSESKLTALASELGVHTSQSNAEVVRHADVIVLGVKPQMMADMLTELKGHFSRLDDKLFVSVAVGITVARLKEFVGEHAPVVRSMPNTPSTLGLGMTGLYADSKVSDEQKSIADRIMSSVGDTLWVDEENKIDALSSVSGSGPAYYFRFMEAMVDKAVALGFSPEEARKMVEATVEGAAAMVKHNPQTDIATLRRQVTSPGGTTQAALETFEAHGLGDTVGNAMQAACDRAAEIARSM